MNKIVGYLILVFILASCSLPDNNQEEMEKLFTKSIERTSDNEFEAGLIEQAENYYPERDEVLQHAGYGIEVPDSAYWYYNSFDGVKIPFSITKEAVDYYDAIIDWLNENMDETFFIEADFTYKATVDFFENFASPSETSSGLPATPVEFENVYVVKMELHWFNYCGSLCALWIDKERIAVFNQTGDLLQVFLDGEIPVVVS